MTFYKPSQSDRKELKRPRGEVFEDEKLIDKLAENDYEKIIAIGDRVSQDIADSNLQADISIVDGSIQREDVGSAHFEDIVASRTFNVNNSAGKITEEAWRTVRKASSLECSSKIIVEGEEDLLALPAILCSPIGAAVVYGQPNEGAVVIEVDDSDKSFVRDLIGFDSSEHLIVGGSWDIFHSGHRYILLAALEKGKRVDIGITSDEMLEAKLNTDPEDSFEQRKSNIDSFLRSQGGRENVRLIKIDDFYGNAVEEGERLLVNPENTHNAERINEKRLELGREEIDVEVLEKFEAVDGVAISCTRIRAGEIDQNGIPKQN